MEIQCLLTCVFKPSSRIPVCMLKKARTLLIYLLFNLFGRQYLLNQFSCTVTDFTSPRKKPVTVPCYIFPMVGRHMFRIRQILPQPPIQASMGANPYVIEIYLNNSTCDFYINFLLYV